MFGCYAAMLQQIVVDKIVFILLILFCFLCLLFIAIEQVLYNSSLKMQSLNIYYTFTPSILA